MTCKYGSHTSNVEELLSSCSDLDTFDDLVADALNQNKESLSPKRKQKRYISYDCLISGLCTSTSPVSENGSSCQTCISIHNIFTKDWEQDPASKMLESKLLFLFGRDNTQSPETQQT